MTDRADRPCGAETALPDEPGTYVLILRTRRSASVPVGRLGTLPVRPGHYAYVGSALGPGGLRGRLRRQLSPPRSHHWHIDHLRGHCRLTEIWLAVGPERLEDQWAIHLAEVPGAQTAMPGFGASDRPATSHLIRLPEPLPFTAFTRALERDGLAAPRRLPEARLLGDADARQPG